MDNKKAKVSPGMIKGVLIVLIMAALLLQMLPTLLHTTSVGVQDVATELSNSTVYGTGAAAIGADVGDYWGYFIVVGILVFLITIALGIFKRGR